MPTIDHDILRRIRRTGRITAGRATLWALAQSGDLLSRFLQPGRQQDVYALYERMRASGPVYRSRTGVHVVTSHALCGQVLRDPRFRVRDLQNRPADFDPLTYADGGSDSFLEQDPPDHTRLRRLAAPAFRPKLIRGYRPQIETIAHDLLDRAARRGSFDLIEDFAAPLPITVITKLLGIPDANVDRFARIGAVIGQSLGGVFSVRQADDLNAASADLAALFIELEHQRRHHPGDDVLSILTAARAEDKLTLDELVATCTLLLIAGFETTVNLIGNATVALAQHPDQWNLLRDDPARVPAAVEETLRWDPSVQATVRVTHEPVELAGRTLRPDNQVILMLAAANRDHCAYPNPDRFDITRDGGPEHLAFSSGIHYCLGAPLARLEGEVALQTLTQRFPQLQVTGPLQRRPGSVIRGYASIPMTAPTLVTTP
ncbi:MAG: cytochrome P450 [Pseudonocardiaceae bacterium]